MLTFPSIFTKYSIVKQIPIFQNLNWFDLQKIALRSEIIEYRKGDTIYSQGEPADAFYCLISGRLQAFSVDQEGQRRDAEFIHRGTHFGIISLMTGEKHSLTFKALNDSAVLRISQENFQQILSSIPDLGAELTQSLSRRIRHRRRQVKAIFESTIISVYSPVQVSGSSMYAANLALSLREETHKKVLLVRITTTPGPKCSDQKSPQPQWHQPAVPFKEISENEQKIREAVVRDAVPIDLLNVQFDRQDVSLVDKISPFVTMFVEEYHFIVVDLPSEMDDAVFKTLTQSDLIHLISQQRLEDLKQVRNIIYKLEEVLREGLTEEKLRVIIVESPGAPHLSFEQINNEVDYDIYARIPQIDPAELETHVSCEQMSIWLPDKKSEYHKLIRKTSRQIGKVLVGLALGGGAALGLAHIGVLKVLEKERIPVDIVVGSSMGALIGSLWVTGYSAEHIERLARQFEKKSRLLKLLDLVIPVSGFIGGQAIKRWLRNYLGDKIFYETEIPLKVVAYDLTHREDLVIQSGSILEAVRKSISIPGVLNPVVEKDRVIIDGGVMNPLPTNILAAMGIKKIIAVNVLQSPKDVTRGYQKVSRRHPASVEEDSRKSRRAFWKFKLENPMTRTPVPTISDIIVNSLMASEYILAEQSGQQADVLIHPELHGLNWYELYRVNELIQRGEEAAEQVIDRIRDLVGEQDPKL